MKMYQNLWTIPCSFAGLVSARMRKVLKEQKWSWGLLQIYYWYLLLEEKSTTYGKNKSFQYLKSMIHDPLLPAKLKFWFKMVSSKLNAFLRGFQTNKPMVPFIADTLRDLVCDFFGKIISKDVLKQKSNLYNLIQIDPLDKSIRKNPENVDIGFGAKLEQIMPVWILQRFWSSKNKLETF